jgi:hypothetical protein
MHVLLAAGALSVPATAVLVLFTLLGTVPVYLQVARRSYVRQGSIALAGTPANWLEEQDLRSHPAGFHRDGLRDYDDVVRGRCCSSCHRKPISPQLCRRLAHPPHLVIAVAVGGS